MSTHSPSPFAPPVSTPHTPEKVVFGIAASGPALNPAEVETDAAAVEVVVMWGEEEILHVEHQSPLREIALGEGPDCAYAIAGEILGAARLPVVIERAGLPHCVVPEGAGFEVRIGEERRSLEEVALVPYEAMSGARLYALPAGATAWIRHRGLTFMVRPTQAGRAVASGPTAPLRRYGWIGVSLGVHALVVGMFYFLPPSSSALSLDQISADDRMVQYLNDAAATREEEPPTWVTQETGAAEGGAGTRAAGEEGAAGDPNEAPAERRFAIQRRNDSRETLARTEVAENMQTLTAIGTLRSFVGAWNVPTSPFGATEPNGSDAMDAIGLLVGADTGAAFGQYGLAMRGTGRGAGGFGEGTIGLGEHGTIGCCGDHGRRNGYGSGVGGMTDRENARAPEARPGVATVIGGMSPDAIRRVVRRHLPEVRFCYEQGLQQNPGIEGRVVVSWIISPTGAVQSSNVTSTSMQNARVEGCIAQAVQRWTFPTPESGSPVGVNYPFMFQSNQ